MGVWPNLSIRLSIEVAEPVLETGHHAYPQLSVITHQLSFLLSHHPQ